MEKMIYIFVHQVQDFSTYLCCLRFISIEKKNCVCKLFIVTKWKSFLKTFSPRQIYATNGRRRLDDNVVTSQQMVSPAMAPIGICHQCAFLFLTWFLVVFYPYLYHAYSAKFSDVAMDIFGQSFSKITPRMVSHFELF